MDFPDVQSGSANHWKEYGIPAFFGFVSIVCLLTAVVLIIKSSRPDGPIIFSKNGAPGENIVGQSSKSADITLIMVDMEGALVRPGVWSLPSGSRVEDAIRAAGGLAGTADVKYVSEKLNRAMKVADGMKIYIPFLSETSHIKDCAALGNCTNVAQYNSVDAATQESSQNGTFVSINMASFAELDSLPGVGPATAQKIIDNRPYKTPEDLVAKKAVGASVYEKIKSRIML